MVAIFTGAGAGLERGSGSVLGGMGLSGAASQGRSGEQVVVNAATGNLLVSQRDEFLVGRGPDLAIGRTYNSLGDLSDENGDNWRQSTDRRVYGLTGTLNAAGSTVRRVSGDGSDILYTWNAGSAAYIATDGAGAYDALTSASGIWTWTDGASQVRETYVAYGSLWRISQQIDPDGNALTFTYTGANLTRVTTADGSFTDYSWSGSNITQIVTSYTDLVTSTAKTLTRTRYAYDASNRLSTVTVDLSPGDNSVADGKTYVTTYTYDGASKRVATIAQTDGSLMAIGYDGSGRVITLTQTAAAGVTRVTTIAYNGTYTLVTDPTGQVTRLDYLADGSLTKITAPPASAGAAAQIVQFTYTANRDLASVIDALGNTTTYAYDARGNVITMTDRLGWSVQRTYSYKNELLTEWRYGSYRFSAAGQLSTRYAYDAEGHLRYKIEADAGITEYRYSASGNLDLIVEYPEHYYNTAGLNPNDAVTEAQLNAWRDSIPDRSSTKITYNTYDARGNLTSVSRYTTTAVGGYIDASQGYNRSVYTYDQAGQLLTRRTDGQYTETIVYDGLGRVVASTDVNQGTTSIVFNEAATQTVVTLASGYVTTSTYNKAGDLLTTTDSGSHVAGGTTTNKYDKLGRLRMTTDATGFNKYFVYDKVGRVVAEVTHRGDLIEYRYDANDRLIATARYINGVSSANLATLANPDSNIEMSTLRPAWHPWDVWSWTTYDKEGRVTSTMDGTIRTYEYDAAGRMVKTVAYYNGLDWNQILAFQTNPPTAPVIPAADSRDTVTRTFYDAAGRVNGTLDAEGYITVNTYDLAGQLVEKLAYFNRSDANYRATGTFGQLLATQPVSVNDRRTRYAYDSQGLLRYEVDGLNQVVEYGYNVARQLISTTRYAGSIAATTDYTYDNVKALVAASGLASAAATRKSWNVYNDNGNLAYAIGAEGAVTAYYYDNRGQVTKTVQYAAARPTTTWPDGSVMYSWTLGQNANAANRVTRYYYSARGELRYTVDAEGYLSCTEYDAAGRANRQIRWDTPISVNDSTTIGNLGSLAVGTWTDKRQTSDLGNTAQISDVFNGENNWHHYNYFQTGQLLMEFNVNTDWAYTYYGYNTWGQLVSRTDANGAPESAGTQYSYDGLGNLKTVTDARNNVTTRAYDKMGRLLTETDAAGGIVSYEYNAFGEVTKVTDARGNATVSSYDKLGRVVSTTDALNYVTSHTYNVFGDLLTVTRGLATTTFEYDRLGRVTKTIDAEGYYEQYTLDAFGNRISVRNKIGGITANAYDRRGLLVAETLPMQSVDSNGNVVAASVTNKFEYDARGNRTKKIEAFGLAEARTTTYIYDKADRLVETRGDAVSTLNADWVNATVATPSEKLKYDGRGRVIERTDALGARTLYYYDQMSRVSVQLGADGSYTAFTYDKNGNLLTRRVYGTAVTLPATVAPTPPAAPAGEYREIGYTYDALNRLKTTNVAGIRTGAWNGSVYATTASTTVTTTLDYDANGNVVRSVDGNGVASYAYYDKRNLKVAEVDAEGYLTYLFRDGEGNVTQEERYATRVTGASTASDPAALRASVAGGGARTTTFSYDKNGRRRFETRVAVNSHALDGNGTLVGGAANATIEYSYNGLGQVTQKNEANGDYITYAYDATGRLLVESRAPFANYDNVSVRPTVEYFYNGLNELTRTRQGGVTAAGSDRITRYTYGAGGRVGTMTDANGATYTYYYDVAGNVMRESYLRYKANGNYTIDSLLYTRDQLGRVTSQGLASWNGSAWVHGDRQKTAFNAYGDVAQRGVNDLWQEQLSYDTAGRLVKSNSGDGVWRFFAYDGNGNQTLTIESEGMDLAAYSVDGAIATATAGGSVGGAYVDHINATIAVFDKRGQQTGTRLPFRQLNASTTQTLTSARSYNAYGEVTSETDARGYTTDFAYNTMGRLTQKQSPNVAYTTAAGVVTSGRPTETYYYDISGRMIAVDDANGNRIRRALLAGTGHGGSEALVTAEYHSDGGVLRTYYDVFGDARYLYDELGVSDYRYYDAMGRLAYHVHRGGLLTDYYGYDLLGQRTSHWNSALGSGNLEVTDYDMQGRVTRQVTFGGVSTTTSYAWNGAIATAGLGTFGGWTKTVLNPTGYTSYETTDLFGRAVSRSDQGGRAYYYSYDFAGRLTAQTGPSSQSQTHSYFNTNRTYQIVDYAGSGGGIGNQITATFGYDANGNRTYEGYAGTVWAFHHGNYHISGYETLQNATIDYDSLGRITAFTNRDGNGVIRHSVTNQYDLVGNVRRTQSKFPNLAYPQYADYETDKWFAYDSMNRMTVADGYLVNGVIRKEDAAGNGSGVAITYDLAGRRKTATHGVGLTGYAWMWVWYPGHGPGSMYGLEFPQEGYNGDYQYVERSYWGDRREEYSYRADGYLMDITFADEGYEELGDENGNIQGNGVMGAALLRGRNLRDNLGRVTQYSEYDVNGYVTYDRYAIVYDAASRVTSEALSHKKGGYTYLTYTANTYGGPGGALSYSTADNYRNSSDGDVADTSTSYSYAMWDDARVSSSTHDADTGSGSNGLWTSTYYYDGLGRLGSVDIADGRRRTVSFASSAGGQVLSRIERSAAANNPKDYYWFVDGMQIGELTNNGNGDPTRIDYSMTLTTRNWTHNPVSAPFRWNTTGGVTQGQFGGSGYDPISPMSNGMQGTDSRYQVREGDTLATVAASVWGDASLWYMIAEANGLSGSEPLAAGTSLIVPAKVTNIHNSAGTFEVYDPNRALGDLSPTAAKPPKKNKCGMFGQILLVVIAVAVTALTYGALTGPTTGLLGTILAGAVSGAAGSIVSQGFGVATGIQDKFSWKGVAMAALSGAVGAGVGGVLKGPLAGSMFLGDAARGALSSALTQGIGVAVGLQKKFDFAAVAAAGVGSAVGGAFKREVLNVRGEFAKTSLGYAQHGATSMASALANATTRSLVEGSDFGDNLLAALPDIIGSTIGLAIADGISMGSQAARMRRAHRAVATFEGQDGLTAGGRNLAAQGLEALATDRGMSIRDAAADPEVRALAMALGESASSPDPEVRLAGADRFMSEGLRYTPGQVAAARALAAPLVADLSRRAELIGLDPEAIVVTGTSQSRIANVLGRVGHFVADYGDHPLVVGASFVIGAIASPISTAFFALLDFTPGVGDAVRQVEGAITNKIMEFGSKAVQRFGVSAAEAPYVVIGGLALVGLAVFGGRAIRFARNAFANAQAFFSRARGSGGAPDVDARSPVRTNDQGGLSRRRYGHTFDEHGQGNTEYLSNRARGSGQEQGQFLDDHAAAQFIEDNLHLTGRGATNVPMPADFPARVILPDGSFASPTHIRLVPGGPASGVRTSFPLRVP